MDASSSVVGSARPASTSMLDRILVGLVIRYFRVSLRLMALHEDWLARRLAYVLSVAKGSRSSSSTVCRCQQRAGMVLENLGIKMEKSHD